MSFTARYNGTCRLDDCSVENKKISTGDQIVWVRRGPNAKKIYHKDCYTKLTSKENDETETETETEGFKLPPPEPKNGELPTPKLSEKTEENQAMKFLADKLTPFLEKTLQIDNSNIDEEKVLELVKQYSVKEVHITVESPDGVKDLEGYVHKSVPEIVKLLPVVLNRAIYGYGGAGAGKTHMGKQIAELLGIEFQAFQYGKLSPESGLKGFMDGNGNKQEQRFIECLQKPSLIFFDEFDRWPSHLTTLLNSVLANGYIDARGHETHINRHNKCYILAMGNTTMRGRDEYFPEATQQEYSTMDRFYFYAIEYDTDLERALTLSFNPNAEPWMQWVQKIRPEAMSGKHGKVFATPRASYEGAKTLRYTDMSVENIADGTVFKGIDKVTKDKLLASYPLPKISNR